MNWYLQGCPVCGGALYDDDAAPGCVECLMCGRAFDLQKVQAARRSGRLLAAVIRGGPDGASPPPSALEQDCCVCARRIA